jgi:hypothetical protein
MAAKKKKKVTKKKSPSRAAKAKKAPARKTKASKPKAKKKTARKPVRKAVKAAAKKPAARKPAKKAATKKKQIVGEGDYQASRTFLKDQSDFVKKNKSSIPAMGKDAGRALEGPEGDTLRQAEAEAASHSRDQLT